MNVKNFVIFTAMVKMGEMVYKMFEEDILFDDWNDFYLATFLTRGDNR